MFVGHVLVVDDDPTERALIAMHMQLYGFEVTRASGALEAFKCLGKKSSPITLIISDIFMPETSGFQLLKMVRNLNVTVPFFLVSEDDFSPTLTRSKNDCAGFAQKPIRFEPFVVEILFALTAHEQMTLGNVGSQAAT